MNGMRWMFGILLLSVMTWTGVPLASSAETCNRVVAVVNNEVITQYELEKKMVEVTGLPVEELKRKEASRFSITQRRILEILIDEKIAEEKIKELNIKVTQKQVDAAIQKVIEDNRMTQDEFLAQVEKKGFTLEKLQQKVKKDLERMQLVEFEVSSKIIIREEAVNEYYQQHKADFGSTEKVRLAGIYLIRKRPGDQGEIDQIQRRGEEILARLRAGENFAELAMKFSNGPGAAEGGDLGIFVVDQLEPQFRKLIDRLPVGSVSGLISMPDGIQILKVVEKQMGKTKSLDEVRGAIQSILYQQEIDVRYEAWIKGLRETAFTRVLLESL